MASAIWDEGKFVLGVAEMDDAHREFSALAAAALAASDADFPARFREVVEHTRRHFDDESRLMRACRFPATAEHEAEHQRLLAELEHLLGRIESGRLAMARAYSEGLPIWFANHLLTMDAALAACVRRSAVVSLV